MLKTLSLILLLLSQTAFSQLHIGTFLGYSNYIGELNDIPFKKTKPALGLSLNYEVSDRLMLRSGFTFGIIEGGDRFGNKESNKIARNLHFKSNIAELSLVGELTAFNLYNIRWSPYVFGGVAVFRFNPYTSDSGNKVYLRPLSTEGQGLPGYPERRQYSLTELSLPVGGGIKYVLNDNIRIGLELGLRKLFTDYVDDVSTTYADPTILEANRGTKAVELSYRGDEYPGGSFTYPSKGDVRGNPETKDWYYFTGLHVTFRLGGGYGKTFASGNKRGYDCPKNL